MKQLEVLTKQRKARLSVISSFTASVKPSIKTSQSEWLREADAFLTVAQS